jgi:hypothetical protein
MIASIVVSYLATGSEKVERCTLTPIGDQFNNPDTMMCAFSQRL